MKSLMKVNSKRSDLVVQIGEKIKRLRLENNLTQEELADRCELSKGFISQLERDMTSDRKSVV